MDEQDYLTDRFEAHRKHLRGVAYRLLGSLSEADDAVQETWLRLSRADTRAIENLAGWLTTVVARVCLDALRARKSRREEFMDADGLVSVMSHHDGRGPDAELELADAVGLALLVVLDTLPPAERIAFVLHDIFDMPFDEIGPIVGRSPTAARQLASRARRRMRGSATDPVADLARQRKVADAFLTAIRAGDLGGLLAVLDPDVVLRADRVAAPSGAPMQVRGAAAVARGALAFAARARFAQPALVDGVVGVIAAPRGRLRVVLGLTISRGKICKIEIVADPLRLRQLELAVLEDQPAGQ
jgi:RNA polymerase sigma-70 factor (ECF subfamily)